MTNDKLSIRDWAEKKYLENIDTIKYYVKEGIDLKTAFKMVMDSSTLGQGYTAKIRKEIGLGMFD